MITAWASARRLARRTSSWSITMAASVSSWRIRRASTGMGWLSMTHSVPRSKPSVVRSGTAMQKRRRGFAHDMRAGDGAKFGRSNVGRSNVGRPDIGLRAGRERERDRGQHGGAAWRTALDFRRIEAMMRFEPDAVSVDEADDRDRDIEQIRGQRGDAVAGGFGRGIENFVAHQRRKAQAARRRRTSRSRIRECRDRRPLRT